MKEDDRRHSAIDAHAPGGGRGPAKLTDRRPKTRRVYPADEIRAASEAGATDGELAELHGAHRATISRIVRGVTQPAAGGPLRIGARGGWPAIATDGPIATLSVQLPEAVLQQIDAVRGRESRSAWVRRAVVELLRTPATPE